MPLRLSGSSLLSQSDPPSKVEEASSLSRSSVFIQLLQLRLFLPQGLALSFTHIFKPKGTVGYKKMKKLLSIYSCKVFNHYSDYEVDVPNEEIGIQDNFTGLASGKQWS